MRKVALVFVLAVFVPSLVLAWLAVRSLRDELFALERQQSLLCQNIADSLAREVDGFVADRQREFAQQVEVLLKDRSATDVAPVFDDRLRESWSLAEVGFVVSLDGNVYSPSLFGPGVSREFRLQNDKFLCNRESVEVYWNNPKGVAVNLSQLDDKNQVRKPGNAAVPQIQAPVQGQQIANVQPQAFNPNAETQQQATAPYQANVDNNPSSLNNYRGGKPTLKRSVEVQQKELPDESQYSKVASTEAEFRQLVGEASEGTVARFLQNKLNLMFWYRSPRDSRLVFGAQINLKQLVQGVRQLIKAEPLMQSEICVALLDDAARPAGLSHAGFQTNWRRPFAASEVGEALPHWEIAVYLLDPMKLTQTAITLKVTLSLLVAVMVLAISAGGWLIVKDLQRELMLARQKTDFVSNVSHELKTPLTSIRMFAELLAEGRVAEEEKRRSYLHIITAEAARLTRLINNVLDFSRMERGEKKYSFQPCDVASVVRETVETYRPHLEQNGFKLECELPESPVMVKGDRDALAQVLVNLISNAEKYSPDGHKEITVRLKCEEQPIPFTEVSVLDRGTGVPRGCEGKIFEQFFRAHDSLSSGIQGSGLGLTLARQIARAHGGEVAYQAREGGGSCFSLRLPLKREP